MSSIQLLKSCNDSSINFVESGEYPGYIESRFVQRQSDRFIVYLSSQTGCVQACRMCHLTATGQTKLIDITPDGFLHQAEQVFDWYKNHIEVPAQMVHFNFMARGEPFANAHVRKHGQVILQNLEDLANMHGLVPKYLVSSIFPRDMEHLECIDIFPGIKPELYYSIYSMDPVVRRKWLPKSLSVELALQKLLHWQQATGKVPKLHFAFIEGVNDSEKSVLDISRAVAQIGLQVNVNIVRYNPHSEKFGREPGEEIVIRNAQILESELPGSRIKIIPRVGFDVKASCGMFVT